MSLCGLEEYDLRWSSPAGGLVTTLGRQILKSNGLASPYSQLKWKFSIKTTQLKALKVFELNSQAKMAPDTWRATPNACRLAKQRFVTSSLIGVSRQKSRSP